MGRIDCGSSTEMMARLSLWILALGLLLSDPGVAQPARRVKDISQAARPPASPGSPKALGGSLYFGIDDGASGQELWKSDGTPQGTDIVRDIAPGSFSSSPALFTELNGLR